MSGPTQTGIPAEAIEAARIAGWRAYKEGGGVDDVADAALVAARPFLVGDAQADERERIDTAARHWADNFGVNVSDDEGDWWDGYRQAQREAVHKAAEFAAQLEEPTDDR